MPSSITRFDHWLNYSIDSFAFSDTRKRHAFLLLRRRSFPLLHAKVSRIFEASARIGGEKFLLDRISFVPSIPFSRYFHVARIWWVRRVPFFPWSDCARFSLARGRRGRTNAKFVAWITKTSNFFFHPRPYRVSEINRPSQSQEEFLRLTASVKAEKLLFTCPPFGHRLLSIVYQSFTIF